MEGINYKYNYQYPYQNNPYMNYGGVEPAVKNANENENVKTLLTAGVLQGASVFLEKASQWCGKKLMQGDEFTNSANIKQIARTMLDENKLGEKVAVSFVDNANVGNLVSQIKQKTGLDLSKELAVVARGENAFYSDSLKLAVAPKSKPSLILHELGHAINAHKGKFLKFLQTSRGFTASLPALLLLLNKNTQRADNQEPTFIEKHAGKIGFCAFLPTIIEEGIASIRGIKAAKSVKNTLDKSINLKPLKRNYAFAWMTYLISGIMLGISTKLSMLENKN